MRFLHIYGSKEIMYHGTSSSFLRKILKKGLIFDGVKKVWNKEVDSFLESFKGIYFSKNFETAWDAARNSIDEFGGDCLIIAAQIETRTPFVVLDEDVIVDFLQRELKDYYIDTFDSVNTQNKKLIIESLNYINWIDLLEKFLLKIKDNYKLPNKTKKLKKEFIDLAKTFYLFKCFEKYYRAIKDKAEKDYFNYLEKYRNKMDNFLKTSNFLSMLSNKKSKNKSIRIKEPVNYKGKNRILCICKIPKRIKVDSKLMDEVSFPYCKKESLKKPIMDEIKKMYYFKIEMEKF